MTKPAATAVTRAEFIERRPEHLRDFYAALIDELPPEFRISTAGIQQRSGVGRSITFCTLFRVKAMVRTPKSKLWSRVVELMDPDGELVECILSAGTLTGKPRDAVAKLSDHGLQIYNDNQIRAIAQLIRNWPVPSESRLTLIEKVGWTDDQAAFILTSGRVITCKGAPKKFNLEET
ncbi:MAG: DUF927 domain-containing protein [Alphaproteobacteria bacterium]|nr:DUF927 domain-containing protein [Alphaproteobacteria bacterium]MBU1278181.1 DUF927 domain-containing protein [Alphaproteobacteria bacterium]MBU1575339.1 DUF927 domain-containing protein [Alphaproteobacteria bacterium]MBU1828946.1 DUF927 domain-containing protein [Alphaproteobacteria bacterium]MBU2079500.1 DUF927 domain-containing protein [Alphaproteobacteria bacterium]